MPTKTCASCGLEFEPSRNGQKYCDYCRKKSIKYQVYECRICGAKIVSRYPKQYCWECVKKNFKINVPAKSAKPKPAPAQTVKPLVIEYKPKRKKNKKSLAEIEREARAQGLTYGQYMIREYNKAGKYD